MITITRYTVRNLCSYILWVYSRQINYLNYSFFVVKPRFFRLCFANENKYFISLHDGIRLLMEVRLTIKNMIQRALPYKAYPTEMVAAAPGRPHFCTIINPNNNCRVTGRIRILGTKCARPEPLKYDINVLQTP